MAQSVASRTAASHDRHASPVPAGGESPDVRQRGVATERGGIRVPGTRPTTETEPVGLRKSGLWRASLPGA